MKEMSQCSPERSIDSRWTCFTHQELMAIAEAYNELLRPDNRHMKIPTDSNDDQRLWKDIQSRFQDVCGTTEHCWIENKDIVKRLASKSPEIHRLVTLFAFKPRATKGAREWLSNAEIDGVMNQYVRFFPNFAYLGCLPSDHFEIHPDQLEDIYGSIAQSETSSIVFNLDKSGGPGTHWVAVFFDQTCQLHPTVEYFDPTGHAPTGGIKRFLRHQIFENYGLLVNKTKHQRGDTECGVYSIYYILQRLKGNTPREINSQTIRDEDMFQFRSWAFRPYGRRWTFRELE